MAGAVSPATLLAILGTGGPACPPPTATTLELRPLEGPTAGLLVDEPLVAAVPAVLPHELPTDTPSASAPLGQAKEGIQTAAIEPLGAASGPTVVAPGDALLARRAPLLNLPLTSAKAVGPLGAGPPATLVVATAATQ